MDPLERVRQMCLTASSVTVDNSVPIKRYWRSGKELLRMANIYREEDYLDKAFILYMKYITLFVEKIPQHIEYRNSSANEKAMAKANCKQIFPIAEELKSKLLAKYEVEYNLWISHKKSKEEELEEEILKLKQENDRKREAFEAQKLAQLQYKLNKQIEHKKESQKFDLSLVEPKSALDSDFDLKQTDCLPKVDRSTKPSLLSFNDKCDDSLRKVIIPQSLVEKFLLIAKKNTELNIETCAILCGKFARNAFTITHVLVPKQIGTADSCLTDNEEEVFAVQDKHDLITVGWIHTHPTQSSFMSSIDLHTHCSYQLMLPEAIAIVCAPKLNQIGCFSLTDSYGLQFIANCKLTSFHPHPKDPPLYQESQHISFDDTIQVNLIDLR